MKRAARHPVRALFLELHVVLDYPDYVCLSFEIVDECLGVTHYLKMRMRVRSTHLGQITPKAFANFSPGLGAQRQPWVTNQKRDTTLKALGMCGANPFRVDIDI